MAMWQGPASTHRQTRKLISGPSPASMILPFNRTQFRVVTGLLTEHNTLTGHLYIMGLTSSLLCRRCGGSVGNLSSSFV